MGQQVLRDLSSGQTIRVIHDVDGNRIAEHDAGTGAARLFPT